jgi:3-dehydroquinate synthase
MVLICPEFLHTLPDQELKSGFAEMIKHALLHSRERWNELSAVADISNENVSELLDASIRFKTDVVLQDPFEKGLRKILNFGHTIGHAIESQLLSIGSPIAHGHAIARGMIAEAWISHQIAGLSDADFDSINTYINNLYPAPVLMESDTGQVLSFMINDKKNSGSDVRFVLLREIGAPIFDQGVEENLVRAALNRAMTIS